MLLAVLLTFAATGSQVLADDAADAARADEQGAAYFRVAAYDEAADEFLRAYGLEAQPKRLFNAALAFEKAEKLDEASDTYAKFLEADPDGGKSAEARARKLALDKRLSTEAGQQNPMPSSVQSEAAPSALNTPKVAVSDADAIDTHGVVVSDAHTVGAIAKKSEQDVATGGRLGAHLRTAVAVQVMGASAVVGGSYGVSSQIDLEAAVVIGGDPGGYVGGTFYPITARLRPMIGLGMPLFFVDGVRPGVRGSAGVMWLASEHLGISVDLGVEYFFSVPTGYRETLFVPTVGVEARL